MASWKTFLPKKTLIPKDSLGNSAIIVKGHKKVGSILSWTMEKLRNIPFWYSYYPRLLMKERNLQFGSLT